MRILYSAAVLVVLVLIASGLYWRHRLAPIMEAPEVRLVPVVLPLAPVGPVRHVDFGYAEFDLPAGLQGTWVAQGDLFFTLHPAKGNDVPLVVGPPTSEADAKTQSLLTSFGKLTGERLTYWEFQKRVFRAQPFSIWTIPFHGRTASIRADLTLVLLKSLQVAHVERIEIFENDRIGVVALIRTNGLSLLELTDKQANSGQGFMLPMPQIDADAVARALVNSYRLKTTDFSADGVRARLKAAGMADDPPAASLNGK